MFFEFEFEKYVILYESKTLPRQNEIPQRFEKYVILYESKTAGRIEQKE